MEDTTLAAQHRYRIMIESKEAYTRKKEKQRAESRELSRLYLRYHKVPFLDLFIFLCSWSMPYSRASAVGGHPGTYRSTGTMRSQPRTTE